MIELACQVCGKTFSRNSAEARRNQKKGYGIYCNRVCGGKGTIKNIGEVISDPTGDRIKDYRRKDDELSSFRHFIRSTKIRSVRRKKEFNITAEYLKEIWDQQRGLCPLTGWQIKVIKNTNFKNQLPHTPDRASLDRIDSSKGYVPGNVRFVCLMAQYAKNGWTDEDLIGFCKAVVAR